MDYKKFYELSFDLMCIVGPTHFLSVNDKFPRHLVWCYYAKVVVDERLLKGSTR